MSETIRKAGIRKDRLLAELDGKLAALPREQQNLAAAYAQGLRAGFRLGRRTRKETRGQTPR